MGAEEYWINTQGTDAETGDAQHPNWWVFLGVVEPQWIKEIEVSPEASDFKWSVFRGMTAFHRLKYSTPIGTAGPVTRREEPIAEALSKMGHWPLPDYLMGNGRNATPWAGLRGNLLREIAGTPPAEAGPLARAHFERAGISQAWGRESRNALGSYFRGLSHWIHGPRKMVKLTPDSYELLKEQAPRWHALPKDSPLAPWKRGVMMAMPNKNRVPLLIYAEPMTSLDETERDLTFGINYMAWYQNLEGVWEVPGVIGGDGAREDLLYWTSLDEALGVGTDLLVASDGTRLSLRDALHVAVNALAALHQEPRILLGTRGRKKGRGRRGAVSGMKRLTLDIQGLRLITRRWVTLDEAVAEEEKKRQEAVNRLAPCLHTVEPHYFRVWVNKPLEHEHVLETRTKTRVVKGKPVTYTQFKVKRMRGRFGSYARGGDLRAKEAKMVTGIGDL